MTSLSYLQIDIFAVCGALLLCYFYYTKKRNASLPLPPGPRPLPIIGNTLDLPKEKAWETYGRWAKEYGDIVHVRTFGRSIIILNSFKTVVDLLERRSSIYSSRPHLTMFHELMDFGSTTAFLPYDAEWRKHRTLYHKQMNHIAVQDFQPSQMSAVKGLLRLLLESPQDYDQHIRHMAAAVVMSIAYGHNTSPKADPFVALAESNASAFAQAVRPGAFLVDSIPILKHVPAWVPGAGFQTLAQETRRNVQRTRDVPFRDVKRRLTSGTARPSFVANALTTLNTMDESNKEVDAIKRVAGGIFGAGVETTSSTIHSFLLAMILYPDVQRKAQAELDSVIGQERLPQFTDRPYLPYIEALLKEVFRWFPAVPTGLPHVTTEDDIYEGYKIPANSIVIGNARKLLHDPEVYTDPDTFRPERFLPDKDGNVARDPAISGAFGFGRRICAGRHLADASVWITAASLLSVLNITNATDKQGRRIDVKFATEPRAGFFSQPRLFPCSIKPRSKEAEVMINQTSHDDR